MKQYSRIDPWRIIQDGFDSQDVEAFESLCSLGNGKMGHRANFEERYSGKSLPGNYFAGVFYPDKTRVGWWKNGYPKYFGKMINAVNWVGIDVFVDSQPLDLATCKVTDFRRTLDMRDATLSRTFTAELPSGLRVRVEAQRFISVADTRLGAIRYAVAPIDAAATITFVPYLDGDVENKDSNYGERFWEEVEAECGERCSVLQMRTKPVAFHAESGIDVTHVCSGMTVSLEGGNARTKPVDRRPGYVAESFDVDASANETVTLTKLVANVTSLDGLPEELVGRVKDALNAARAAGFEALHERHRSVWSAKWETSDVVIDGSPAAQQGVRFCIFQLHQTYTGEDDRLNIGPKGFTGEKYGGGTYWDTEAFCFPFYLSTAPQTVARNLLVYRYRQLPKAIANAEMLGYKDGAALYPMVTINGEECHNEWEITFEEIHRNGAIAYAIWNYVRYTGDDQYLASHGLESLMALARFWAQRATYSTTKQQYVILGVTGPNEYENNVNNNWYTNYIAAWTLRYALDTIDMVKDRFPDDYARVVDATAFDESGEPVLWRRVAGNMLFPVIEGTNIFLQQEGYLDKEQLTVSDIPAGERPINQHWSWDRILRSPFIKQADVLQGMYFFLNDFPVEVVRDNFNYYEPRTVHESSLSASIHSVIAAHIGDIDRAYELFQRSARLDLDDYNNEVHEGLHITSMAGTWLALVEGFAGKRIIDGLLSFRPSIPPDWTGYAFKLSFREHLLEITVGRAEVSVKNVHAEPLSILLYGAKETISANETVTRAYSEPGRSR